MSAPVRTFRAFLYRDHEDVETLARLMDAVAEILTDPNREHPVMVTVTEAQPSDYVA